MENSTVEAGKVITTTPAPNTKVDPGSTVAVQVAKAAAQVPVPQLSGQPLAAAKQALQTAGLAVGSINGPQDDDAVVITSDPAAGQQVAPGTAVNLQTIGGDSGGQDGGQIGGGGPGGDVFGGPSGFSRREDG